MNERLDLLWWLLLLVGAIGMAWVSIQAAWRKRGRRRAKPAPAVEYGCLFGARWKVGEMADRNVQTAARTALGLLRAEHRRLACDLAAYQAGDESCRANAERAETLGEAIRSLETVAAAGEIILILTRDESARPWQERAEKMDTEADDE